MYQFVYWLKAAAAVLITNSHYAEIWPVSAMAAGGQLGNCLFFLVSGFCLSNIKEPFGKWYAKRIIRIYPALWIAIIVNLLLGFFKIDSVSGFIHCFFYPTWYHFIGSIMLLYILFYFVRMLQKKTGTQTIWVIAASLFVYAISYILLFDSSYYHIDDVQEKWVRFQFWGAMLAGIYIREKEKTMTGKINLSDCVSALILLVSCFGFKLVLRWFPQFSAVQGILPLLWILLSYRIATIAMKLERMRFFDKTTWLNKIVRFLASITLEIYLGQNVIIYHLSSLSFPLNFAVVTALIILFAWTVHRLASWVQKKSFILCRL